MFINQKYLDIFTNPGKTRVLTQKILDEGYVLLPQFLSEDIFAQLKALDESRTMINKKNEELKGTLAHDLVYSDELFSMCEVVIRHVVPSMGANTCLLNVSVKLLGSRIKMLAVAQRL